MALPSTLYTGDGHTWTDSQVPAGATGATVYFRTAATDGVAVEGELIDGRWTFTLASSITATMTPGDWGVQFVAALPTGQQTYRPIGRVTVVQGLAFTGEPSPLDPRTPAEIELAELRVAIRAVYRSAEYSIGTDTGSRRLKRADLPWLLDRERQLLQRIASEARTRQGIGRRVLTTFDNQ